VKKSVDANIVREGNCSQPGICPLSSVKAGTVVCIKQLAASADVMGRLREMGFCEEQQIKLISREGNLICQVATPVSASVRNWRNPFWWNPSPAGCKPPESWPLPRNR